MRTLLLLSLLWASPSSAQTYPDMVGMFAHQAGTLANAANEPINQWAWGHEAAPPGCSDLHWWDFSGRYPHHFERFCLSGAWVRFVGQQTDGEAYLTVRTLDGELGQKYALVAPTEAYSLTEVAEYVNLATGTRVRYLDFQSWAPTGSGWSQQEVFRWLSPSGATCAFHAVSTFASRVMFVTAAQTFVSCTGLATHGSPLHSAQTWMW